MSKNSRGKVVILPNFQYRITFFVCSFFLFYGITLISLNFFLMNHFYFQQDQIPDQMTYLSNVTIYLSVLTLIFTGIFFITLLSYTHKVAGPIYKTKKVLKSLSSRKLPETTQFRKKDYFKGLSKELAELVEAIIDYDVQVSNTSDQTKPEAFLKPE